MTVYPVVVTSEQAATRPDATSLTSIRLSHSRRKLRMVFQHAPSQESWAMLTHPTYDKPLFRRGETITCNVVVPSQDRVKLGLAPLRYTITCVCDTIDVSVAGYVVEVLLMSSVEVIE